MKNASSLTDSLTLIIPAYNEIKSIARTISEAVQVLETRFKWFEIIVAADGDDGTYQYVEELGVKDPRITVIGGKERLGKGRGIREAVKIANCEIIGFTDADNKTPITEISKVIEELASGYDIVIGSRAIDRSLIEQPQKWYRRYGSAAFRMIMHFITGLHEISDTQCGFKFFKKDVAKDLFSRQSIDGYMFDVEILFLAKKSKRSIAQVPVRWRDDGDSRLVLFSGNIRNLLDVIKIRLNSYANSYNWLRQHWRKENSFTRSR